MLPVLSQIEADLTTCFEQDIFSEKDTSGKQSLQQMLSSDQEAFLFLAAQGAGRVERHIARLRSYMASERITLLGIALKGVAGPGDFQGLCLESERGTFAALLPEDSRRGRAPVRPIRQSV